MQPARMSVAGAVTWAAAVGRAADSGIAQGPRPAAFLDQVAGEWTVVSEAKLGPGKPPCARRAGKSPEVVGTWLDVTRRGMEVLPPRVRVSY